MNQQYQQQPQQPQQPQYQQPQAPMPSAGAIFNGFSEKVCKLIPTFITIFLGLAVLAVAFYLIYGIVVAIDYKSFGTFLNYFTTGLASCARYSFYAGVLALLKKYLAK